jgi:LmbE family N-acetylglucosaminyl deacetylase
LIDTNTRALVLAAHTDDEFGCAGTMARLIASGAEVHYLALSRCEESVPPGFPSDVLEGECRKCLNRLGLQPANVMVEGFRVRHFPAHRQEILERFVALRRQLEPNLVLVPASFDTHQDHRTVYEEGFRAFKYSSILGYELPQNLISFSNSAFITLKEEHLTAKVEALNLYASQRFRAYAGENFIRSLAHVRGVQSGVEYAEAFELIRLLVH